MGLTSFIRIRAFAAIVLLFPFITRAGVASAAVFQYAVPVTTDKAPSTAYLWLPPQATQIRGVVMAGMTLMEREFAKDVQIRGACAQQQLAIVFLQCGLSAADPQKVLDDLAKVSGYHELSVAPLMFVGHSAGGPQAHARAVQFAGRCFGLVQYRGGGPWADPAPAAGAAGAAGSGNNAPPVGALPDGIPSLMMLGEFDEFGGTMRNAAGRETWEGGRDRLAEFRAGDPRRLAGLVVEPGAGHFAWSERNAAYLALFIRKAAAARIPDWGPAATAPPVLKAPDVHTGWLTDLSLKAPDDPIPAPYDQYKGDKARANWHFDEEQALATIAYHRGIGKKDQFIRWNDPYHLDAGARFFFDKIQWVGDGQTFEVHPVYADKYPAVPGGPRWALANQPAGHSAAPILVKQVSGPAVAAGPNTLRIEYDALAPAAEGARITFMAYSTGDAEYRYTEQVGMLNKGFRGLTDGKDQSITFPPIGNLKANGAPVALGATSDSGLPVEYYVASGPATVEEGGKLKVAELPARASFPIEVKVVAWQFGRGVEPRVKSAEPVEQTIRVEKS